MNNPDAKKYLLELIDKWFDAGNEKLGNLAEWGKRWNKDDSEKKETEKKQVKINKLTSAIEMLEADGDDVSVLVKKKNSLQTEVTKFEKLYGKVTKVKGVKGGNPDYKMRLLFNKVKKDTKFMEGLLKDNPGANVTAIELVISNNSAKLKELELINGKYTPKTPKKK